MTADITIPAGPSSQNFRLWVAYPRENIAQKVDQFSIKTEHQWYITAEPIHRNKFIYVTGRLKSSAQNISIDFHVTRKPLSRLQNNLKDTSNYLKENVLVTFAENIKKTAKENIKNAKTKETKTRALYDYIVDNMKFASKGERVGMGDAKWACDSKTGNCADFHSVLVAMLRYQKIPARTVVGLSLPRKGARQITEHDFHTWMEVHDSKSWTPVDAQEANGAEKKKWASRDYYYKKVPSNRIALSIGRDIVLAPKQKGKPLNFFRGAYAEINGKEIKKLKMKYTLNLEKRSLNKKVQTDKRKLIALGPRLQMSYISEMQKSLRRIQGMIDALLRDDWKKVNFYAKSFGLTKKREKRLLLSGNEKFANYGYKIQTHHTYKLIDAARKKDKNLVLSELKETIKTCVACHQSFRFNDWPNKSLKAATPLSNLKLPKGVKKKIYKDNY